MDDQLKQVRHLIRASDRLPWGVESREVLGEAIALADAAGDEQHGYAARMRLVVNAALMDDHELMLSEFAICEALHRRDPVAFPVNPDDMNLPGLGYPYADLNWMWKWIPGSLRESPDFTLDDIEDAFAGMTEAYNRAGLSGMAVYQRRLASAVERGVGDEVRHWADLIATTPHDEVTDCEACTRSNLITAEAFLGNTDRALTLLQEIVDGGYQCSSEPAGAYSESLVNLARAGRTAQLRQGLEVITEYVLGETADCETAGLVIAFLARAGELARALSLTRRTMHRVSETPLAVRGHEIFLTGVAVAAHLATRAGLGGYLIPEADAPGLAVYVAADQPHTAASLASAAEEAARVIAARFDARNGTDAHTRALADRLASMNELFDLDLGLPPDADAAFVEESGRGIDLFRTSDPLVAGPVDAGDALATAINLHLGGRLAEALGVARDWLPRIEGGQTRALLLFRTAAVLADLGELAAAEEIGADAQASLSDLGWPELAQALTELGPWCYRQVPEAAADGVAALVANWTTQGRDPDASRFAAACVAEVLSTRLDAAQRADLIARCAKGWERLGRHRGWVRPPILAIILADPDDAEQMLSLTEKILAEDQLDAVRVLTLAARTSALIALGRVEEAFTSARERHVLVSRWANAEGRVESALLLLQCAAAAERGSETAALSDFIDQMAGQLPPGAAASALYRVGHAEAQVGNVASAERRLARAIEVASVDPDPDRALLGAAEALRGALADDRRDRNGAAKAYVRAAEHYEAAGDTLAEVRLAIDAAAAYLALRNHAVAGHILEAALPGVDAVGDWELRVRARHLLAWAASQLPRGEVPDEAIAEAFADALSLAAQPPTAAEAIQSAHALADIHDTEAWWHIARDRFQDAVAAARLAVADASRSDDRLSLASTQQTLARCLWAADADLDEAARLLLSIAADEDLPPAPRRSAAEVLVRLAEYRGDDRQAAEARTLAQQLSDNN